jgi:hypothetical protein
VTFADGTRVHLGRGGVAAVTARTARQIVVALDRGTVQMVVTRRRAGERLEVVAGRYVFRVIGTQFQVSRSGGAARLVVSEGVVAVVTAGREMGRISAGQEWVGAIEAAEGAAPGLPAAAEGDDLQPAAIVSPPPQPPAPASLSPAPASPAVGPISRKDAADAAPALRATDCLTMAREGSPERALVCFGAVARGDGLEAEIALYETARLRRDVMSDPRGGLASLAEYHRRFPAGSLRDEALTSTVDLMARVGDAEGALARSAELLERAHSPERRAELHMVRGNVFRQLKRDWARAEAEYARAASAASAPLADDAAFWRAVCIEAAGARERAATAFTSYLQRPKPRHAAEARARLQMLQQK